MHASMCIYVHYTVFTLCVAVLLVFLYFFICNIYPNGNMILYKQSNNKENRAANKGPKKNNYKGWLSPVAQLDYTGKLIFNKFLPLRS